MVLHLVICSLVYGKASIVLEPLLTSWTLYFIQWFAFCRLLAGLISHPAPTLAWVISCAGCAVQAISLH